MYYNVYAGNKHIDMVIAKNEQDAIHQVTNKYGNASSYTSLVNEYKAVKA